MTGDPPDTSTLDRMVIAGMVTRRGAPAAQDGAPRELALRVAHGGGWVEWTVLLSSPQTEAEAADLIEGDFCAFAGPAPRSAALVGPEARRLRADRALNLRPPSAEAAASPVAEPPVATREAFEAMLEEVQRLAIMLGAAVERGRIIAIMNAPDADGRLALAWRLAESGLDVEAARRALLINKIEAAAPAVDAGAALTH